MATVMEERMEVLPDRATEAAEAEEIHSPVETDVEVEITTTTTIPAVTVGVSAQPWAEAEDRRQEAAEEPEELPEEEEVEEEAVLVQEEAEELREEVEIFEDTRETHPMEQDVGHTSEAARLEEKLRQFQHDMENFDGCSDGETVTGTSSMALRLRQLEKQRRRNIIFDEERFEETFLKCLICREVYDNVGKVPKMLPCHHTFCLECLREMFRVEGEYRQTLTSAFRGMPMAVKIHCPTCRDGLITSQEELRRLPNDHTILELLTFVKDTGRTDVQYCSKHQMQPLNFFCEPCIMPVCCDCTVIDHKESKGHVVVNVEEALKKYTPILESTMEDISQERTELEEKRITLEEANSHLNQIQTELTRSIRQTFDRVRETIDERERELFDMSEAQIHRKRSTLDAHMKTLTERVRALQTQHETLKQSKADKDISLMFTGHKAALEVLAKKVNVPTDTTKDFSVTFQYNARKEGMVRQELENLGDIEFQS